MRAGEFPDGAHVLRAKIDMAHPNMIMRDPLLLRIRHAHRITVAATTWCIYPLYDFAHGLSRRHRGHHALALHARVQGQPATSTTGSCARPASSSPPEQTEFARLELDYTVLSKRKLLRLVNEGHVNGWDDPRMPTIAGLRRRGVTPEALRNFCETIGVARKPARTELATFEHCDARRPEHARAARACACCNPLKVVLTNYPEGQVEELDASYYPHDVPLTGSRKVPFSRELWIERDDFMEDPPKKFFRLAPGREVRLRYGYFITCTDVVKDDAGNVVELRCTYDPATRGGDAPDGRKVQGTIHWVSARACARLRGAAVRPAVHRCPTRTPCRRARTSLSVLNPESLVDGAGAKIEPSVAARSDRHRATSSSARATS